MTLPVMGDPIELIDQRVAKAMASGNDTATGVITSVASDMLTAQVTFDGSSVSAPVLIAGHVLVAEGDRVALQRFGGNKVRDERPTDERLGERVGQWVVMAALGVHRTLGSAGLNQAAGSGQRTTNSWANFPGNPSMTLTKVLPGTAVICGMYWSGFADNIGTVVEWGMTKDGGSTTDKFGDFQVANTAGSPFSDRQPGLGGFLRYTGLAAGQHTFALRWKLPAGVYFEQDSGDWVSAFAVEW